MPVKSSLRKTAGKKRAYPSSQPKNNGLQLLSGLLPRLKSKFGLVVFIILFAGVGSYLILSSHAATQVEKGVVSDITWGTSRSDIDKTIALMQQSNVKWIRSNIAWTASQPDGANAYNSYNLGEYDYAISKARAAGINIEMPIADGVPYWASGDPSKYIDSGGIKHWNKTYKPTNVSDYTNFVSFVVNRYKAYGVHTYEIWNEPNLSYFWPSGVSAADYYAMLKASYPVVKAADPAAKVVLGGLSQASGERANNFYDYLTSLYALGAKQYFDIANIHIYSQYDPGMCWMGSDGRPALDLLCGVGEIHKIMLANSDDTKSLWITEMGASTCTPVSTCYGVNEAQQADYLTKNYALLNQTYNYVNVALVYNFRNDYWLNNNPSDYEANSGLMRTDFSPKPAYDAFKAYGSVTVDTEPPTSPTNPSSPFQTTNSVSLTWTASTDNVGVTGYDVYRNNVKVSTVGTTSYSDTGLTATTTYYYYVIAKDASGNSSPLSATVTATTQAAPPVATDTAAPTVSITSPANNSTIGNSTNITATATDNILVTKMQVYIDGSLRTTSYSSYATYGWSSRKAARGAHTITVKAYDAAGNASQSSVVVYK